MRVGVLNTGSSSLKFKLFVDGVLQRSVLVQNIGKENGAISIDGGDGFMCSVARHDEAVVAIFRTLGIAYDEVDLLAHRIVHGGEFFSKATFVDDEVLKKLSSLKNLNPLHNEINLSSIKLLKNVAPTLKQVALFDTAFHQSLKPQAYLYAIKKEFYHKFGIRRYGFHGLSHSYLNKACAKLLNKSVSEQNIITLHLGNGASICAIKDGKSIDTSMGFTPLEGLVMGSRSGDIDAGVLFYMQRELGMSVDEIDDELNKNSGLKALGGSNDVREIKDEEALDIFALRAKKYIGAYMALLGRVDAIVFSGGIGEHSVLVREKIMDSFGFGVMLDSKKNAKNETLISKDSSSVKIFVINTDEESEMASQIEEDPRFKDL